MHRDCLSEQTEARRGSLSYYLGGKAPSDPQNWTPNIGAVQATIKYAIATGRREREKWNQTWARKFRKISGGSQGNTLPCWNEGQ